LAAKFSMDQLPVGVTVNDYGNRFEIVRSWRDLAALILLGACAVFWFVIFGSNGRFDVQIPMSDQTITTPVFHILIGLCLHYAALAKWLNKTVIRVNYSHLEVKHGPIWWWGNRKLEAPRVEQIYTVKKKIQSRHGVGFVYQLMAIVDGGKDVSIVKGMTLWEEAVFIEEQIEKYMKIKDRFVIGQFSEEWRRE
jgi:hypothetical protein